MRHASRVGLAEMSGMFGWQSFFAGWLVNAFCQVALFALLAEALGNPELTRFLIIGNAVAVGTFPANGSIAASTWDRADGTYSLQVVSPSSILPGIIGRTIVWLGIGSAMSIFCLALSIVAFDLEVAWPQALLAAPIVILTMASAYTFGLFLGSIVTLYPGARNILSYWMRILVLAFVGVSVPVTYWPGWIESLVNILPLTQGLRATRELLDGGSAAEILPNAAAALLVALGWLALATLTIDRLADRGRRNGSIEFV